MSNVKAVGAELLPGLSLEGYPIHELPLQALDAPGTFLFPGVRVSGLQTPDEINTIELAMCRAVDRTAEPRPLRYYNGQLQRSRLGGLLHDNMPTLSGKRMADMQVTVYPFDPWRFDNYPGLRNADTTVDTKGLTLLVSGAITKGLGGNRIGRFICEASYAQGLAASIKARVTRRLGALSFDYDRGAIPHRGSWRTSLSDALPRARQAGAPYNWERWR
jgi:hypothetical protein